MYFSVRVGFSLFAVSPRRRLNLKCSQSHKHTHTYMQWMAYIVYTSVCARRSEKEMLRRRIKEERKRSQIGCDPYVIDAYYRTTVHVHTARMYCERHNTNEASIESVTEKEFRVPLSINRFSIFNVIKGKRSNVVKSSKCVVAFAMLLRSLFLCIQLIFFGYFLYSCVVNRSTLNASHSFHHKFWTRMDEQLERRHHLLVFMHLILVVSS